MTHRLAAVAGVIASATTAMCLAISPHPVSASSSEDVVRQLYTAFKAHEAAALVAHVSDDVRWMTVAGDTVVVETSGRDALRASMSRYFRSTPTVRSRIVALMAPCTWDEVQSRAIGPRTLTLRNMSDRIEKVGDLWADMGTRKRSFTSSDREAAIDDENERLTRAPLVKRQDATNED